MLHHRFFGAAFALIRPIVESTVRAHVSIMGSENDLRRLKTDQYSTNFKTVGKQIDTFFHMDNFFENFLNKAAPALHSYTHGGLLQVSRRFDATGLTANYPEGEIMEVIRTTTCAVFMVNNLVTKYLGFDKEWEQCTKMFEEWANIV